MVDFGTSFFHACYSLSGYILSFAYPYLPGAAVIWRPPSSTNQKTQLIAYASPKVLQKRVYRIYHASCLGRSAEFSPLLHRTLHIHPRIRPSNLQHPRLHSHLQHCTLHHRSLPHHMLFRTSHTFPSTHTRHKIQTEWP